MARVSPRRTTRMREVEVKVGEDLAGLLFRLYYTEKLTLAQIVEWFVSHGAIVSGSTVYVWMVRFGLDRRQMSDRGASHVA